MYLKKAIVELLETITDESLLMYFYALLRKATSSVETEDILEEIISYRLSDESSRLHASSFLEAS